MPDALYEPVLELVTICLARATGQDADYDRYQVLRSGLVAEERVSRRLPAFIRACRDLESFWSYIQPKFPSYAERRAFIRAEFQGLLDDLEHDIPTRIARSPTSYDAYRPIRCVRSGTERRLAARRLLTAQ